jgi:hypothetical protein
MQEEQTEQELAEWAEWKALQEELAERFEESVLQRYEARGLSGIY